MNRHFTATMDAPALPLLQPSEAALTAGTDPKPKILFVVTEDWYFCSHRLGIAIAARKAGWDVVVATRVRHHGDQITRAGLKLVPLTLERKGQNPFREVAAIWELFQIYRRERPALVHHVALKPILYGSVAAACAGVPSVVNAIAGLGFAFTSSSRKAKLFRPFIRTAFRVLLNRGNTRVILQNPDDSRLLIEKIRVSGSLIRFVRGCGANLTLFHPVPEPAGLPIVVFPARLLWDKGVREFVEAAQILRQEGIQARFVLVGDSDPHNLSSASDLQIQTWKDSGAVECWGWRTDMPAVYGEACIVCLPSYREGLPKVLVEAAACGRPLVATDVPGCREVVRHNDNGFLVPARDSRSLAIALKRLILDRSLRQRMGGRSRQIATLEFSEKKAVEETLAIYREMLR